MRAVDRVMVDGAPQGTRPLRPWTAFGLCAGILAAVVAGVFLTGRVLGGYLDKAPVPLHKPLGELDRSQIGPYRLWHPESLPDEVIDALKTREYIQWVLEDPRRPAGDPLRYPVLFVTYYTGGRTQVPHTPERCHLAVNWAVLSESVLDFPVRDGPDGQEEGVSAKCLLFNKPGLIEEQKRTVVYTFYANCRFTWNRNVIRLLLADPRVSRSFFSKVEVSFAGSDSGLSNPDPQQAADAARQVLQVVLPVLVRDHWPRYEDLQKADAPAVR